MIYLIIGDFLQDIVQANGQDRPLTYRKFCIYNAFLISREDFFAEGKKRAVEHLNIGIGEKCETAVHCSTIPLFIEGF